MEKSDLAKHYFGQSMAINLSLMTKRGLVWPVLIMAVALAASSYLSINVQLKWILWLSFGLVALSLDFIWGKAGIFCFGQSAFFGIGAYTYAVAAINWFPATGETLSAVAAAIIVASVAACVIGYVLFYGRVSDVYFAIVTLAITLTLYTIMSSTSGPNYRIGDAMLGGFNGMPGVPGIAIPGFGGGSELSIEHLLQFAILVSGLSYIGIRFLSSGAWGLTLSGIRESEVRMELLGYDSRLLKLTAFTIGGALAGLGGAVYVAWGTFVNPSVFSLSQAALIVTWVMVGGRGSLGGAFIGVIFVQWIADNADRLIEGQTPLILGGLLIAAVLFVPGGLAALFGQVSSFVHRRSGQDFSPTSSGARNMFVTAEGRAPAMHSLRQAPNLTIDSLTKNFGGLHVLRGINLKVSSLGIQTIIGANGAGKSTLFSLLTGRNMATTGRILLGQQDITRLPTFRRARAGLGIKTQVPSLYMGLTVEENLTLAINAPGKSRADTHHNLSPGSQVALALDIGDLWSQMDTPVSELSHGAKQWLEIAVVLAADPAVVLLDEPAAGMTKSERTQMVSLVARLAEERTIIVVEHDMAFIRALDAPVAMLHNGRIFRSGSFDDVCSDPEVINAYLGRRDVIAN